MSKKSKAKRARSDRDLGDTPTQLTPARTTGRIGGVQVTPDSALKASAVWASCRLRANLISSLPVDVFRYVNGLPVSTPLGPLLSEPDVGWDINAWLWATQFDLDRFGNAFGIITARDGFLLPARIELVPANEVTVIANGARVTGYKLGGKRYEPGDIWHERQYRAAGMPVGMSPLTHAAWTIGGYLSAQQFGLDYFGSGAAPLGVLKNTERTIPNASDTAEIKAKFKAATSNRDIFVTGRDWEWSPAASEGASMAFIEDKRFGLADITRYFDVPTDLIDIVQSGTSVTYANVTSRMVQLLVTSLNSAIVRREKALARALPTARYMKLNGDALLRLDPETRTRMILARVAGRILTPSEARALDDLPPFSTEQLAEIAQLFPNKATTPQSTTNPEVKAS